MDRLLRVRPASLGGDRNLGFAFGRRREIVDREGAGQTSGIGYVLFRRPLQERSDISAIGSSHDPPARIDTGPGTGQGQAARRAYRG